VRRAAKVDANHASIRDALRKMGATVYDMSAHGRGLPDLLVTHRQADHWLELKDGDKSPSRRTLTKAQADLHAKWTGAPITVLLSVEEAVKWWQETKNDEKTLGSCGSPNYRPTADRNAEKLKESL
jgi:hypothetical protein